MIRLNKYTLATRDRNCCKHYCSLTGFGTTKFMTHELNMQNKKHNCRDCLGSSDELNAAMKLQCSYHLNEQTFVFARDKTKPEVMLPQKLLKRGIFSQIKCYLCKELPVAPKIC